MVNQDAIEFCSQMVNIFQLADAFVMDIALTNEGYKIVECGCINCAGFYDANLQKLVVDLENFYRKKRNKHYECYYGKNIERPLLNS